MFSALLNMHVQTSICCTISPWAFLTLLQALEIGASTLGAVRRATNLWWRGFIPQADARFGASNSVAFTHLSWQRRPTSSSSSHPPPRWIWHEMWPEQLELSGYPWKLSWNRRNGEILADWGFSCCGIQTIPLRIPKTLSFCKDQYLENPKLLLYHPAAVAAVSGYKRQECQSRIRSG